jgi:hypothetical protein
VSQSINDPRADRDAAAYLAREKKRLAELDALIAREPPDKRHGKPHTNLERAKHDYNRRRDAGLIRMGRPPGGEYRLPRRP